MPIFQKVVVGLLKVMKRIPAASLRGRKFGGFPMAEKLLIRALTGGKSTRIITLNGKKMKKMPSTLERLTNLKTLDLQNNLIPKVCPEISTLTQLTMLNLGNNLLKEVPKEMKYLISLKKLHLFGNKIRSFEAEALDGLQNLILLNLNNNQLTDIPKEIRRLKSLTHLSMNHNQLASIPRELCFLKNLSELQLNYNQLVCLPNEIKFLKNLEKLHLARNSIEVLPEEICDLRKLRLLDVAGNIIQLFPPRFQNLKLKEFYCEGNPLFLKEPVNAVKQDAIWSLQEITSRYVMKQLARNNPLITETIQLYPEVKNILSKARKCAICGELFLTIWLECVQFIPPQKELNLENADI